MPLYVLGAQMMTRAAVACLSNIGASGTVTKTTGSKKQTTLEVGTTMLLNRMDPKWRQLYTPRTNATALNMC